MEHPAYTQAVERPESPIVSAPMATRLDAPLLAIMFNLLEGRDRWRRLPILHSLSRRSPQRGLAGSPPTVLGTACGTAEGAGAPEAMMSPEGAV
jgi:hypothetical protein